MGYVSYVGFATHRYAIVRTRLCLYKKKKKKKHESSHKVATHYSEMARPVLFWSRIAVWPLVGVGGLNGADGFLVVEL